jgi:hypothetical protein
MNDWSYNCFAKVLAGHPLCQGPPQQTSAMAHGIAGAATSQGCGDRACQ